MSCAKMNDYLDGLLVSGDPPVLDPELSEHIQLCASCRSEYEIALKTFKMLQPSFQEIQTNNLKERIMSHVRIMEGAGYRTGTGRRFMKPLMAAAAAVVILLFVGQYLRQPQNAYALASIVEAARTIKSVHIRIVPAPVETAGELWAQFDDAGQLERLRISFPETSDGPKDVLWHGDKALIWFRAKNSLVTIKDEETLAAFKKQYAFFDPAAVVERLKRAENVKVSITRPSSPGEPFGVTAGDLDAGEEQDVFAVDPVTNLVLRHDRYGIENAQRVLLWSREYLDYNTVEDTAFVLEAPDDVVEVDQTEGVGIAQGELSDEEIATEVVTQFFEAMIARDYGKASPLFSKVPPDALKKTFARMNFTQIVSIGEPEPHEKTGSLRVPCQIEYEAEGKKGIMEFFGPFVREVPGQPGVWTIIGGI